MTGHTFFRGNSTHSLTYVIISHYVLPCILIICRVASVHIHTLDLNHNNGYSRLYLQAKTAALFEKESGELGPKTQPGQPVYGLEHSNGGLITFPGGVPLR